MKFLILIRQLFALMGQFQAFFLLNRSMKSNKKLVNFFAAFDFLSYWISQIYYSLQKVLVNYKVNRQQFQVTKHHICARTQLHLNSKLQEQYNKASQFLSKLLIHFLTPSIRSYHQF